MWLMAGVFFIYFLKSSANSIGPLNIGDVTKRDLACQSMSVGSKFPKKVWQTWKVDTLNFEERDATRAKSWTTNNPGHRHEVLTDANALHWVEETFGPAGFDRPDIVYMFRHLTLRIIKADLLRYLIMFVEGGIYTDIDVENLRAVDTWIPGRYDESIVDLVIGVEIDEPGFASHPILGRKSMSFCQWTFMAKPRLPVMLHLIDNILKWLESVAKDQNVDIKDIHLSFDDVIAGTGPSAFTRAILAEMSVRTGQDIDWTHFHDLREPKLVGGVLVMTVEAFAAGQGHSNSGNHDSIHALVKHHYHASKWPTTHPRYSHPMYGQVEDCNWVISCVQEWDKNMADFKKLSEADQAKMIKDKEASSAAALDTEFLKLTNGMSMGDLQRLVAAQGSLLGLSGI